MEIGTIYDGKVTGIAKFGCFVEFDGGKSGIVHISEISNNYVKDINDVVKIGQEVSVRLIKIDEKNRINLSIKKAEIRKTKPNIQKKKVIDQSELTFEEKMKMFMTNSQERLSDIKQSKDKKTGGKRRK